MTSITLISPKFENNLAMVVRLAAAFNIPEIYCVKPRFKPAERIPRELRMFRNVKVIEAEKWPSNHRLVAVERRENAESLLDFVHPATSEVPWSYVFGPEDGEISQDLLRRCSRFVQIPVANSMNLATAVAVILWDLKTKSGCI